jgi:hypothetical protein
MTDLMLLPVAVWATLLNIFIRFDCTSLEVSFCGVFLADDSDGPMPGVFGGFDLLEELDWGVFLAAGFGGTETGVFGRGRLGKESACWGR